MSITVFVIMIFCCKLIECDVGFGLDRVLLF